MKLEKEVSVPLGKVIDLGIRAGESFGYAVQYPLWALIGLAYLCPDLEILSAEEREQLLLVIESHHSSRKELPGFTALSLSSTSGDLLVFKFQGRRFWIYGCAVLPGFMRYFTEHASTERWRGEGPHPKRQASALTAEAQALHIPRGIMNWAMNNVLLASSSAYGSENGWTLNIDWNKV